MLHEESRPGGNTETAFQTHHHHQAEVRTGHQCSRFDDLAARGRRRAARHRSTVISACACTIKDPDVDRHRCGDGITDRMAEAAVAAAEHLQLLGTPGLFDRPTCQAMWRADHHELAAESFRYSHGEAA
jgi:hypothetical protein